MTEAGWRLVAPDGMDDLGWFEVASKGVLMGSRLAHGDRTFPVIIYDPVRLSQDAEGETADGGLFYEANVIVVDDLTRESAEAAVTRFGAAGQFDWLLG